MKPRPSTELPTRSNRPLLGCLLSLGAFDLFLAIRSLLGHGGSFYGSGGPSDPYAYNWVVLLLFAPYAFALRAYARRAPPSVRAIAWVAAAVAIPLVLIPPLQSRDVIQYVFYGKMQVAHGANPYVSAPLLFRSDPWFPSIPWPRQTSVYGPLWSLAVAGCAAIARGRLVVAVVLTKFLALALGAVAAWGLTRIEPNKGAGLRADRPLKLLAFSLNPLVITAIALGGHADAALAAAFVWAMVWDQRGRPLVAGTLLAAASLVKLYAAIPFAVYVLVQGRKRRMTVLKLAAAAAALAAAAYAPYWAGAATFRALVKSAGLTSSGLAGTIQVLLARAFHGLGVTDSAHISALVMHSIAVILFAAAAVLVARSRRTLAEPWRAAVILTSIFLLVTPWFVPWYLVGPLALAIPLEDARLRGSLLTFSGTSLIQVPGAGGSIRTLLRYSPPGLVWVHRRPPDASTGSL